jgi:hypothetical protein
VGQRKRARKWSRVETEEGASGYGEVLFKQVGTVMSDSDESVVVVWGKMGAREWEE